MIASHVKASLKAAATACAVDKVNYATEYGEYVADMYDNVVRVWRAQALEPVEDDPDNLEFVTIN